MLAIRLQAFLPTLAAILEAFAQRSDGTGGSVDFSESNLPTKNRYKLDPQLKTLSKQFRQSLSQDRSKSKVIMT